VREGMESRVEIICRLMISWRAVVKGGKKEQFSACPNSFESVGEVEGFEGMAESASLLRRDAFSTSDSC
jgi:hypothetical protein